MTKVQWKSGCDYSLLSYEHFYLPHLPSKMGLKKCILPQQMECRCGPTATETSLKVTWKKVLIKYFRGSALDSETKLHTQRCRTFPKPEKWLIFGILAKGESHENFYDDFTSNF